MNLTQCLQCFSVHPIAESSSNREAVLEDEVGADQINAGSVSNQSGGEYDNEQSSVYIDFTSPVLNMTQCLQCLWI